MTVSIKNSVGLYVLESVYLPLYNPKVTSSQQ